MLSSPLFASNYHRFLLQIITPSSPEEEARRAEPGWLSAATAGRRGEGGEGGGGGGGGEAAAASESASESTPKPDGQTLILPLKYRFNLRIFAGPSSSDNTPSAASSGSADADPAAADGVVWQWQDGENSWTSYQPQ